MEIWKKRDVAVFTICFYLPMQWYETEWLRHGQWDWTLCCAHLTYSKMLSVLLRAVALAGFSTALVRMMRFSPLRSLAWKVRCSAAWHCSQKMSSPSILCWRTGTNCWPQIKYLGVKKKELWHLCCHTVHLGPHCALGPILLQNRTNCCLEMHPAAVLKHREPFVSILRDINKTFISSENWLLWIIVVLVCRFLCHLSSGLLYLHTNVCVVPLWRCSHY